MWNLRRSALVVGLAVAVTACGASVTEEQLADVAAPLVEAHEELQDFRFRIEGGRTDGAVLETWPDVSATVRSALDGVEPADELPEEDLTEIIAYAEDGAASHDRMLTVVQRVRDFIRDDAPEEDIGSALDLALSAMDRLDDRRTSVDAGDTTPTPDADIEEVTPAPIPLIRSGPLRTLRATSRRSQRLPMVIQRRRSHEAIRRRQRTVRTFMRLIAAVVACQPRRYDCAIKRCAVLDAPTLPTNAPPTTSEVETQSQNTARATIEEGIRPVSVTLSGGLSFGCVRLDSADPRTLTAKLLGAEGVIWLCR